MPAMRQFTESKLPPILWPRLLSDSDLAGSKKRRWIQVAKTGEFFSNKYGNFSITGDDLQQMLTNFLTVTPIGPTQLPVDYDHLSMDPKSPGDGKAAAWFVTGQMQLRADGQELWAEVEWTDDGLDAIQKKHYRFISPSFIKDYVWKNGKNIGTTLVAAAITNHPFLEGMAAITMSVDMGDLAAMRAPNGATAISLAEVGQKVSLQPGMSPAGTDPAAVYDVMEVVGNGDDQFVKLKDAAGGMAWHRVVELVPAPAQQQPAAPAQAAPAAAANPGVAPPAPVAAATHMRSDVMDVFKLNDATGKEVDVKAEDVKQFLTDQLAAAKKAPEGQVLITASQLSSFEGAVNQVTSLASRVEAAEAAAKAASKSAHVTMLTADLDSLSKAARITKPQRDYALSKFGEPDAQKDYEDWKTANVSAKPLVGLEETGSGGDAEAGVTNPSAELNTLALSRSKEKGISLTDAITAITAERPDLALAYHKQINAKAGQSDRVIH